MQGSRSVHAEPTGTLRVFVSSTSADLSRERSAVCAKLRELNCDPVNFEGWTPNGQDAWERIRGKIRSSDVFVLILGSRYGWIPRDGPLGDTGKSVTHLEFEEARRSDLCILPFQQAASGSAAAGPVAWSLALAARCRAWLLAKAARTEGNDSLDDAARRDAFREHVLAWGGFFRGQSFRDASECAEQVGAAIIELLASEFQRRQLEERAAGRKLRIHFRRVTPAGTFFCGLLVLRSVRAWVLAVDADHEYAGGERIGDGVIAVPNPEEAFRRKQADAMRSLRDERVMLEGLQRRIGRRLALVYPIEIPEWTSERFYGSDQQYILTNRTPLPAGQVPMYESSGLCALFLVDGEVYVARTPEAYLREAFGIITERLVREEVTVEVLLRENAFSRNAKYVSITPETNAVVDAFTMGRKLFVPTQRLVGGTSDRAALIAGLQEREKSRLAASSYVRIDSAIQSRRRRQGQAVSCDVCMDERWVIFGDVWRQYRVPCRACNADHDQTWRAFD